MFPTGSNRASLITTAVTSFAKGRKTKEKVEVYSYELLAYRSSCELPGPCQDAEDESSKLPDYFVTAEDISPVEHVDIQAAAQDVDRLFHFKNS